MVIKIVSRFVLEKGSFAYWVAAGHRSKLDLPPKLGPFIIFHIYEYSLKIWSCPLFVAGSVNPLGGYTDPLVARAQWYFLPIVAPFSDKPMHACGLTKWGLLGLCLLCQCHL